MSNFKRYLKVYRRRTTPKTEAVRNCFANGKSCSECGGTNRLFISCFYCTNATCAQCYHLNHDASKSPFIIIDKMGICKTCFDHLLREISPEKDSESDEKESVASCETPIIDPDSCLASLVADNIKLVYLKKSLVDDLMKKQPHCWKSKLIGSYVRVKTDPRDYSKTVYQYHQLAEVQGIYRKSSSSEFLLQVLTSNVTRDIPVSQISDANFTEEECEDLRQDVASCRLLGRPTVSEFEHKARELHEDVTKHWIKKEMVRLQSLIDWTNEKGMRIELDDYLDQRELLKQVCEQERLLKQVPRVIAEIRK